MKSDGEKSGTLLRGFEPVRFRTFFLLGAAWMTIAAIAAVGYAVHGIFIGSTLQVGFNAALAAMLLLAVRALLRMRSWGLLLGGLISIGLLAIAPFYGTLNAITLTLAAIPALVFWLAPVVLAQRKPKVRIGADYRVATEASDEAVVAEEIEEEAAQRRSTRRT